jgi:hypothetical protein
MWVELFEATGRSAKGVEATGRSASQFEGPRGSRLKPGLHTGTSEPEAGQGLTVSESVNQ